MFLALLAAAWSGAQVAAAEPPGEPFAVEEAADLRRSLLALTFDPAGRAFVAVESGPVLWLADGDGDGRLEQHGVCTEEPASCHGLLWHDGALYAVGERGGAYGLDRITLGGDGRTAAGVERLLAFEMVSAEHGAHGVCAGPDGALYVSVGNLARPLGLQGPAPVFARSYGRSLLPELPDPSGTSAGVRDPGGSIVRADPATGRARLHSVGYRNAYRAAFSADGELFTADSDMELDLGMPWYVPPRVLRCVYGGDYGSRKGAGTLAYVIDVLPEAFRLGRSSPTAVAFGTATKWPEPWRSLLYVGDWTGARVFAIAVDPPCSFDACKSVASAGRDLQAITDLAPGPDGNLWLTRGGRGEPGGVFRMVLREGAEPPAMSAPQPPQEERAEVRLARELRADLVRGSVPPERLARCPELLADQDLWVRHAARIALEEHGTRELVDACLARWEFTAVPEAVLLAARRGDLGAEVDVLLERLLDRHDRMGKARSGAPGVLRAVEVVLTQVGTPGSRGRQLLNEWSRAKLAERALFTVPSIAHLAPAIELPDLCARLVEALETYERPPRIQSARALATAPCTPDATLVLRALRAIDADKPPAETGASYGAWIERICGDLVRRTDAAQLARAAAAEPHGLSARSLAQIAAVAPGDQVQPLLALVEQRAVADPLGRAALPILGSAAQPEVRAWLRALEARGDELSGPALAGLARRAEPEDVALYARGLESRDLTLAQACASALASLPPPTDPAIAVRAFVHARAQGHLRGWDALTAVARWTGTRIEGTGGAVWVEAIRSVEMALRSRWPSVEIPAPVVQDRPRWSLEQVQAIFERSADRRGSAHRGAAVFARATCARCHVAPEAGESGALIAELAGPDLRNVGHRMSTAQLLESVWDPSRTISDQYRAWTVETTDEQRWTGRLVRDDAQGVALLEGNGTRREIERGEVSALAPSAISPMPAGLLDDATLEEVRDLLAFLTDDARGNDEPEPEWERPLEGAQRSAWDGDPALWKLKDGLLAGRAQDLTHSSWIVSRGEWTDFEAELDVRLTRGGNSGFQYRSRVEAGAPNPIGYQADLGQIWWGSLYATDGRGMLHEADAVSWRKVVDIEGWNHVHVLVDGDRHRIEVNGAVLADVRDGAHRAGRIAFQLHEGPPMDLRVTNVRIRSLR